METLKNITSMFNQRRKARYVIPAFILNDGKWELIANFPDFTVFGDDLLSEVLNISKKTINTWKRQNIIPYEKYRGGCLYKVNDVIQALKKHGYYQEQPEGNPTGPAQ